MKLDKKAFVVTFVVTGGGVVVGAWQAAALAGFAGAWHARERPYRSAVGGTLVAWLLVLLLQLGATSAGRVVGALGGALLGVAGLPVLVVASLLFAALLALLGALVGRSLKRVLAKEGA